MEWRNRVSTDPICTFRLAKPVRRPSFSARRKFRTSRRYLRIRPARTFRYAAWSSSWTGSSSARHRHAAPTSGQRFLGDGDPDHARPFGGAKALCLSLTFFSQDWFQARGKRTALSAGFPRTSVNSRCSIPAEATASVAHDFPAMSESCSATSYTYR
jgi:hypothetical protein